MKRKSGGGGASWMDTYGDMVTLLLCFLSCSTPCLPWTRKKWIALVQSFNPTEEVTNPAPSASGVREPEPRRYRPGHGGAHQAMQDYVQQAGMANQVTLGEGNGYVFISFDDTVFLVETATNCGMRARLYWTKSPRLFQRSAAPSTRSVSWSYRPGRARPGEQRHGGPLPGLQPCHSGYYLPTGKRHN